MSDAPIARHLIGIWTREQRYLDPPVSTPYLVWRNVYEVSDGTRYESPNELCAPLEECTEDEREAANGLPVWVPPYDDPIVFSEDWKRIMEKEQR